MEKGTDLVEQESHSNTRSSIYDSLLTASVLGNKSTLSTSSTIRPETSGGIFSSMAGSSVGSMVWRSPDDLYRCNICDMKFSQLSGLQVLFCRSDNNCKCFVCDSEVFLKKLQFYRHLYKVDFFGTVYLIIFYISATDKNILTLTS